MHLVVSQDDVGSSPSDPANFLIYAEEKLCLKLNAQEDESHEDMNF